MLYDCNLERIPNKYWMWFRLYVDDIILLNNNKSGMGTQNIIIVVETTR